MRNDSMINYYIVMIFCLFQCSARYLGWGNSASYAVDRFIRDRQLINVQTDLLKSQGKWLNFDHSFFQIPSSLTNYSAFVSTMSTSPWVCRYCEYFLFLNSVSPEFSHYHTMSEVCRKSTPTTLFAPSWQEYSSVAAAVLVQWTRNSCVILSWSTAKAGVWNCGKRSGSHS